MILYWTVALVAISVRASASGAETMPAESPGGREPSPEIYDVHYEIDVPVIVGAASFAVLRYYVLASYLVDKRCPCDPREINPIDRHTVGNHSKAAGIVSDVYTALAIAGPPLLDLAVLGFHRTALDDVTVFAETVLVEVAIQQAVGVVWQRPRPLAYAGDPSSLSSPTGYQSFFAGHVGSAVAALSAFSYTIRLRYGEQVWPWVVTGFVGASIAVERVASGAHFPTDVAAGALVGFSLGIAIPWLHAHAPDTRVSFLPVARGAGLCLSLGF